MTNCMYVYMFISPALNLSTEPFLKYIARKQKQKTVIVNHLPALFFLLGGHNICIGRGLLKNC